jgi:hypothetical protein
MELLLILLAWPLIIFAVGLLFITFGDFSGGFFLWGGRGPLSIFWWVVLVVAAMWFFRSRSQRKPVEGTARVEQLQRGLTIASLSLLLPVFVRYLILSTENALPVVLFGLAFGFGLVIWGMFIKQYRTIMYANIAGGALTLIYVYSQLWSLGEGARIVAAGTGLVIAVVVSILKFKNQLIRTP